MTSPRFDDIGGGPGDAGWAVDRFGAGGRPIVLLNDLAFDRSMWWPVAADLADAYTVAVVQPPAAILAPVGPEVLQRYADDLACFVADLGNRAPVVVGHGRTAGLAVEFGAWSVVQAVVTVDPHSHALDDRQQAVMRRIHAPYLCILGGTPTPTYATRLRSLVPAAEIAAYGASSACPHLTELTRFTADLRRLAC